jgi:hypothetical protein
LRTGQLMRGEDRSTCREHADEHSCRQSRHLAIIRGIPIAPWTSCAAYAS